MISYLQRHRAVWVPGMSVYVLYMKWACCCYEACHAWPTRISHGPAGRLSRFGSVRGTLDRMAPGQGKHFKVGVPFRGSSQRGRDC